MVKILDKYFLGFICLICALMVWYVIQPGHDWGGDFAQYIQQAKYLSDGNSIHELYDWNKASLLASKDEFGPYLYPMGFPILLSLVYSIFGMNFIAMKLFCGLFLVGSIPFINALFKKYFSWNRGAMVLVILVAFNFQLIFHTDNVLSDLPFLFFCYLSLYLMELTHSRRNMILLGFVLFYAFFTRELGVFLLPAYGVYQFIQREKFKNLGYQKFIPYGVFLLLFLVQFIVLPQGSRNHFSLFIDSLSFDVFFENLHFYIRLLSRSFFFGRDVLVAGVIIGLLMAVGAFSAIRKHGHFVLFSGFYLLTLMFWDNTQATRFILPVLPILFYFLIQGLLFIGGIIKAKRNYAFAVTLAYCALFTFQSVKNVFTIKVRSNQSYTSNMKTIYDSLNSQYAGSNAIIGFEKPRVLWLFSDVKSIYTDESHFTSSTADLLLISKDDFTDTNTQKVVKEFDSYFLIRK